MATKSRTKVPFWITIPLCALTIVAGVLVICFKHHRGNHAGRYQLNPCDFTLQEKNNTNNNIKFDSTYETQKACIYFDTEASTAKAINKIIETVYEFEDLFAEKNINPFPKCIYVSKHVIFHSWAEEDGSLVFSMPSSACREELLAWLLYFSFTEVDSPDLKTAPYGLYAGISSYWLQTAEYKGFIASGTENAGCLTELQFPLYEQGNLSEKERAYAWSFSTYLVESMISHGKIENEILTMDQDTLDVWLKEHFNISLPHYRFKPYPRDMNIA